MLSDIRPVLAQPHTRPALDCKFDPCGRRIGTVSADGTLNVYDAVQLTGGITTNPVAFIKAHESPVLALCFGPLSFGRICATAGLDRKVKVWLETQYSSELRQIYCDNSHKGPVTCLAFTMSPGAPPSPYQLSALASTAQVGLHLASGSQDGSVIVHALQVDHAWTTKSFVAHPGGVCSLSWSTTVGSNRDGQAGDGPSMLGPCHRLATCGADGTVRIWLLNNAIGQWVEAAKLTGHQAPVVDVAWMPCHDRPRDVVASLGADGTLIFWTEDASSGWQQAQVLINAVSGGEKLSWTMDGGLLGVSQTAGDAPVKIFRDLGGYWEACQIPPGDFHPRPEETVQRDTPEQPQGPFPGYSADFTYGSMGQQPAPVGIYGNSAIEYPGAPQTGYMPQTMPVAHVSSPANLYGSRQPAALAGSSAGVVPPSSYSQQQLPQQSAPPPIGMGGLVPPPYQQAMAPLPTGQVAPPPSTYGALPRSNQSSSMPPMTTVGNMGCMPPRW